MKRLTVGLLLAIFLGLPAAALLAAESGEKETGQPAKPLRVGTFDSRVVALAYYRKHLRSPEFAASQKKLREEHDQAKAAGDTEKAKKLEAEGRAGQAEVHRRTFGSAPIDDLLAKIHDQLPEIAKQAGVDLIVSKWNVTYRVPGAETVDVTEAMAKLFQPDEQTWKMLRDFEKHPPLSAEELQKHEQANDL